MYLQGKISRLPFWHQEAEITEEVAMQYNLRPLDVAAILASDRRRLLNMQQPPTVTCQLFELWQEMEGGKVPYEGRLSYFILLQSPWVRD